MYYRVTKISDIINIIIPHFLSFPLLTRKKISFTLWCEAIAIYLLKNKAHKHEEGLIEILCLYYSMGRGASEKVKLNFTNLIPSVLPEYNLEDIVLEPYWISGYLTIYCNFQLVIMPKGWKLDIYYSLRHLFSFSRNIQELDILNLIAEYLGANVFVRKDGTRVDVNVSNLDACKNLIKFLDKHPLQSSKHQEYLIWREFVVSAKSFNNSYISGSLDNYISHFQSLIDKLNQLRD